MHSLLCMALFKKLDFFKLKLSPPIFYSIIVSNAFLNYIFQMFDEKANVKNVTKNISTNEALLLGKE